MLLSLILLEWLQTQLERLQWLGLDLLAPLGEHSRPRWFLERRRTCRHLQTAEDTEIAGIDVAGWCRETGLRKEFIHASSDLEKHVQPIMESAVVPSLSRWP